MRERGEKPLVTILEVCSDNWRERERYWISYFRLLGVVLENITAGGDGATFGHRGPFRDTEARRLRLRKGWQEWWDSLTAEERKKSTSHKMSEEMKAKLSRERKGIPQSLEHRQAVVASKRTPEYHAKASSSQRQAWANMSPVKKAEIVNKRNKVTTSIWASMTEEQRKHRLAGLLATTSDSEKQRSRSMSYWSSLTPEKRREFCKTRNYWDGIPPEERSRILKARWAVRKEKAAHGS